MTAQTSAPQVELLSCPFCGSQAATIGPYGGESLFGVQCLQCNAGVRGFDQCEQDARDAWNTRPSPDSGGVEADPVAWRVRFRSKYACETWRLIDGADRPHIPKPLAEDSVYDVEPLYATPQASAGDRAAFNEILKHVRAPRRESSERLDRIEAICVAALAAQAA